MDMDTDFEQDLAKVIDNQRAQTVFNRWKMRTTKDRAESSSSIGSITETAAEVQECFLIGSFIGKRALVVACSSSANMIQINLKTFLSPIKML